jgi:hypothetical protein
VVAPFAVETIQRVERVDERLLRDVLRVGAAAEHAQRDGKRQPLVSLHQGEGLSTSVVDVRQVYRQFGDGRTDAAALASYIKYAAANRAGDSSTFFGCQSNDAGDGGGSTWTVRVTSGHAKPQWPKLYWSCRAWGGGI